MTEIINYYEQYRLSNELLDKFEKKITDAETLLEVFDVMKEMFEILMGQISASTTTKSEKINFLEMDEEEQNEKENLEKVLQKYQSEIRTHIKTEKELEKMIIELNSKVESAFEQMKLKNEYILVFLIDQKLEKDIDSLVKRNDELETANIDLKKYFDAVLFQQKSNLVIGQVKKSTSKGRTKKGTPRSPLQQNRILRSYNTINQLNSATAPFSKGFLNNTLKPSAPRKAILKTQSGINSSMHDVTNKSVANCMINNLYFIPKSLKRYDQGNPSKFPKRRSLSKINSAHEPSFHRLEPKQSHSRPQRDHAVKLIDQLFHNSDQKHDPLKLRTSSIC